MTMITKEETNHQTLTKLTKGHFLHPTANGRQDVLALKQQLADALGENGPLYWDALRDFVMGKLNRQEFDFYANLYLSRHNGKSFCTSSLFFFLHFTDTCLFDFSVPS
jgi:hypothetical protein